MKSYFKISAILLFSIFITVIASPIIASITPFHLYRVMGRAILIVSFFLFYYYRDELGFQNLKELGFELFNKRWWLLLILGLFLGLFSMFIISLIMINTSIRFIIPDFWLINWMKYITEYLLIGLAVAFIEECFFRGFILQTLLKDTKIIISLIITNALYSIVHFLNPEISGNIDLLNLLSSLKTVPLFFTPLFTDFFHIWPSIIGLFLVGIVLSMAYIRVRTLALSIGLHAGWIIGIKSLSLGTDVTISGHLWISGNVIANPITWCVLSIFILILSLTPPYGIKKVAE